MEVNIGRKAWAYMIAVFSDGTVTLTATESSFLTGPIALVYTFQTTF